MGYSSTSADQVAGVEGEVKQDRAPASPGRTAGLGVVTQREIVGPKQPCDLGQVERVVEEWKGDKVANILPLCYCVLPWK